MTGSCAKARTEAILHLGKYAPLREYSSKAAQPPIGEKVMPIEQDIVSFNDDNCKGVIHPHDDVLVVTMLGANYTT